MRLTALPLILLLTTGACGSDATPPVFAEIGSPLPGLSPEETEAFEAGRAVFARIFTPDEGLGPRFNENSCSACHTFPVDGGTGETAVRKATRHTDSGRCDLLSEQGGENLRIQVTPALAQLGGTAVPTPPDAHHETRFAIPFVFGLGLVDAIPYETLEALADPDDSDGDGISGRVGRDRMGRPARFGRKADVASLDDFNDSALRLEMGLTTPAFPDETWAGAIPPVPPETDPAPEPEVDLVTFAALSAFVRFLAPPAPANIVEASPEARGRRYFEEAGCADCHVPTLQAGPHPSPAIANRTIALYSDLLLHDMGAGLAGTCGPAASTTEYRTEPLMGLRYREAYLHDGRARRVRDAIIQHGGEAVSARRRFLELHRVEQEALLRFLGTL